MGAHGAPGGQHDIADHIEFGNAVKDRLQLGAVPDLHSIEFNTEHRGMTNATAPTCSAPTCGSPR